MTFSPRIIGGQWKGRKLIAPDGLATRPTGARARQAVFDILLHAPWGGPEFMQTARVLDVFAGTGAYGLEALSRGAAFASFIENDFSALAALRANIAACRAEQKTKIFAADARHPPPGAPHGLVFLDPPYGQNLVPKTIAAITGWIAPAAVMIAELGPGDAFTPVETLAERTHGKARLLFWRA
jgi:16S rRNA (guanine966-N2)-methyltransferase